MRIHLKMLGCRLNQSEIDTMARQFQQQGHEIVDDAAEADQVIVNTCAVTREATKSGRKLVRELHRANAAAEITVTGCYAQIAPDDIAVLPGVKRVVDNQAKNDIVETLTGEAPAPFDAEPHARDNQAWGLRTRAFVKVQDGCDNACTFCVTTVARGDGQSRDADAILNEIQHLHATGYQEVVLTGVHLGSYGHDWGDAEGLKRLTQRILDETAIPRLRLSSLEPWDLAAGFFDLWQNPRLCPHLHLPLQSGCDDTLRRMRRNTNQAAFRELMQAARAKIPDVRITSDVIAGFPGETDDEFNTSAAFIREMNFAGLHVFPYSVRPGTPAARMRGHLPKKVKKARVHHLMALSGTMEQRFAEQFIGRTLPVLWEQINGATENGFISVGYTHNYIRVQTTHPRDLTNHLTDCHIESAQDGVAYGTPIMASSSR